MSRYYILDGHTPVACGFMTCATWLEANCEALHVARTQNGDVKVSTVFLGINHQYGPEGPPMLFETMIFGGAHDEYQDRCSTWEQAEVMHAKACATAFGNAA